MGDIPTHQANRYRQGSGAPTIEARNKTLAEYDVASEVTTWAFQAVQPAVAFGERNRDGVDRVSDSKRLKQVRLQTMRWQANGCAARRLDDWTGVL